MHGRHRAHESPLSQKRGLFDRNRQAGPFPPLSALCHNTRGDRCTYEVCKIGLPKSPCHTRTAYFFSWLLAQYPSPLPYVNVTYVLPLTVLLYGGFAASRPFAIFAHQCGRPKKVLTLASFEVRTLLCLTLKNKMSLLVIVCQFMFKLFPVQLLSGEPKWRESVQWSSRPAVLHQVTS